MTEIDALIAGFGGGCLGGLAIAIGIVSNLKKVYDQKIMVLRMQITGLQAINGVVEND